jgi:hypothetical protein
MFSSLAFANGSEQQNCETVPVQSTTLGSGLVGSADATGGADAGFRLHAIVHADYTDPFPNDGVSVGAAQAGFQDQFRVLFPGIGPSAAPSPKRFFARARHDGACRNNSDLREARDEGQSL